MREIKFRAWDGSLKCMYATDSVSLCIDGEICYLDTDGEWVADMANRIKLMQYTGLKDKNGTEIYEGDVIQFTWDSDSCWGKAGTYLGYIRVDGGAFEIVYIGKVRERRFREGAECFDDLKSFMDWSIDVRIIANIYENPELLQEVK